jgi:dUTP pyrophosphatase
MSELQLRFVGTEPKRGSAQAAGLDLVSAKTLTLYPAWYNAFWQLLGFNIFLFGLIIFVSGYAFLGTLTASCTAYLVYFIVAHPAPFTDAVNVNLKAAVPEGHFASLRERSGWALKGLGIGGGVCDSDYMGDYKVILRNLSAQPIKINEGDKIAQLIVQPYVRVVTVRVDSLDKTVRGEAGFGSTGN